MLPGSDCQIPKITRIINNLDKGTETFSCELSSQEWTSVNH